VINQEMPIISWFFLFSKGHTMNELEVQTSEVETTTTNNPAETITETELAELTESILATLPLGLSSEEKIKTELSVIFQKIKIPDNLVKILSEPIITEYEKLHYREMAKIFYDYGLSSENIKIIQYLKDNVYNLPDLIWNMRYFNYDIKKLFYYEKACMTEEQVKDTAIEIEDYVEPEYNENDFIIKDLLYKGNILFMCGKPKYANKTRVATYLSVCISKGLPFLNFETTQQRCLCLFLEDNHQSACKRIKGFNGSKNITIECEKEAGALKLKMYLEKGIQENNPYGFVVIDTYLYFTMIQHINDYAENVIALKGIKKIAEKYNVGIVIIHHTNKQKDATQGDDILGSVGIAGTNDGHIIITPFIKDDDKFDDNSEIKLSMNFSLRNFKKPDDLLFTINSNECKLLGTTNYAERKKDLGDLLDFIKSNFNYGNYFSTNDLLEKYNDYLKGRNKETLTYRKINLRLNHLKEKGNIILDNGLGIKFVNKTGENNENK
jgi:hypothetical protein